MLYVMYIYVLLCHRSIETFGDSTFFSQGLAESSVSTHPLFITMLRQYFTNVLHQMHRMLSQLSSSLDLIILMHGGYMVPQNGNFIKCNV